MRRTLVCPNCRKPLQSLDARGQDYFCQACFTSVAVISSDLCYYQLGRLTGRQHRCSLRSLEPSA